MSDNSSIEWTDATWNPVTGCTKVSPGCDHCYAETFAERWRGTPGHHFENGFDLTLRPERLGQPLRWKRPRRIFVNSMSDLFHADVPDEFIARVFAVMAVAPQHTFQLLTKRHGRMRSLLNSADFVESFQDAVDVLVGDERDFIPPWPLPNVWLGVSVEDQKRADLRIPALLETPAAVRWISAEPLLGPVDLSPWLRPVKWPTCWDEHDPGAECPRCIQPEWVVVGGESGPGARPMHPAWARDLRDQCTDAGVAFLFKQFGGWAPRGRLRDGEPLPVDNARTLILNVNGNARGRAAGSVTNQLGEFSDGSHCEVMERVGKKAAGRELDGRTWDEFPTTRTAVA